MIALKEVYKNGFTVSSSQDSIITVPLPVDVLSSIQSPQEQDVENFKWWRTDIKPTPDSNGCAWFRGDINYPTNTETVTTVRIEATSHNPLLREAEETWGSISFYTPIGQIPDPKHDVIMQWHSLGGSPSFSFNRRNGFYRVHIHHASGVQNAQVFNIGACVPGQWEHFVYRIVWSDNIEFGRLTVWKNGQLARLYNTSGTMWKVPMYGSVTGISGDWLLKPETMGNLPYTVVEEENEVSVLDWYGKTTRSGQGESPEKYFKCGIYASGLTDSFVPGGGLRTGWDDPESEYYIPPVSRVKEIGIANVKMETRVDDFSHLEIYKGLSGEPPTEVPNWWVDADEISITSPVNQRSFEVGQLINIVTNAEDGEVDLIVNNNMIETKSSPPYSFQIQNIPINGAVVDLPFDGNLHNWGDFEGTINLVRPENISYVGGERGQAIKLFNGEAGNVNRSYIIIPNEGNLANISNSFTISFWAKAPAGSGLSPYFLNSYASGSSGIGIRGISSGLIDATLYDQDGIPATIRTSHSHNENEFTHFCLTYDGQFLKWYCNFIPDSQMDVGNIDISATTDWIINASPSFIGTQDLTLDDVRIYDYAIPEEEIHKTSEDNYLGQIEIKARKGIVESDPVTINIVESIPTFTITATATTGGQVSGDGEYEEGETANLVATPTDEHWVFVKWTENGEDLSTANPLSFTVEGNRNIKAVFAKKKYALTVTSTTGGTVTGDGEYDEGDIATLEAIPDVDYEFDGWSEGGSIVSTDNPWSFVVTGNRTITPVFTEVKGDYEVEVIPSVGGYVTGGGFYKDGEEVVLLAHPYSRFKFVKWDNDVTDNPYVFNIDGDTTISAIFESSITPGGAFKVNINVRIV